MSTQKKPKVIIFDIGGVCVVSPMKSILEYEQANDIPKGYINYAISASKPHGAWHRAEIGEIPIDSAWFKAFKADIERASTWERYHQQKQQRQKKTSTSSTQKDTIPPIPNINAETLYWQMMSTARVPDPYMSPALKILRKSPDFHIAALSNTTILPPTPPSHIPTNDHEEDVRSNFDLFISSAHVGLRKPNRDIYELAMKLVREKWPADDIQTHDVVFLDDIGENLKTGREMGWRTIKVLLGRTDEAVKELEGITGLELLVSNGDDSKNNDNGKRDGSAGKGGERAKL